MGVVLYELADAPNVVTITDPNRETVALSVRLFRVEVYHRGGGLADADALKAAGHQWANGLLAGSGLLGAVVGAAVAAVFLRRRPEPT